MPARRTSRELKLRLADDARHPADASKDAELGGLGIDWSDIPPILDEFGRAEWQRLSRVFAHDPVRFREADRAALVAYATYWAAFVRAAENVALRGPVVPGRSDSDRERLVKNPSCTAMREAAVQLRFWIRELALSPDSRGRTGITDTDPKRDDVDNPFAG